MPPSQEVKKLKKAHKQRLAAEANAARAEEFGRPDTDGSGEGKKRKTTCEADDDVLEAAVAAGDAAARSKSNNGKSNNKNAKKQKSAAAAAHDDDVGVGGGDRPSVEELAAFREEHGIRVAEGVPDPIIRFQDAPFPKKLIAALLKQGYTSPSPIQAQAWPIAVTGRDVIAVAKTGSGKTCAFLLPALSRIVKQGASAAPDMEMVDGRFRPAAVVPAAIILAPTRELAIQIGDECAKFCGAANAKVVTLYGGASKGDQLRLLRSGADVIVATPGRLNDFLAPPPGFSVGGWRWGT
jgi:ATP-dependent RNA helicase DDX5/DBP2